MNWMIVVWSVVILTSLGVILGLGLAIASKIFHVKVDTRVEDISAILPNANCGACGYPGCQGYAEAIVAEVAESLSQCKPGLKSGKPQEIRKYLDEHPNPDGSINKLKI